MTARDRRRPQAIATDRSRRLREASVEEPRPSPPPPRPIPIRRILKVSLVLGLVLLIGGGWLLWQRVARFNEAVSSAESISELALPLMGSERVNVVFYGYGGESHEGGRYLADSINILSFDPATASTTIVPIPRDLWVEGFPQLPDNGKVNETFAIGYQVGGITRAADYTTGLLAEVTGLELHAWLALDFAGFRAMVDTVGGVVVENPRAFSYTWFETEFDVGIFEDGSFSAGTIELDGDQALTYARARYTSVPEEASDFARSIRQQRVLAALQSKLGTGLGALGPGLAIMDRLESTLVTNLSVIDLYLILDRLDPDRRIELAEGLVLEATSNSIGQYILVVIGRASGSDYRPLQAFLAAELARPMPSPEPSPSVSP